MPFGMLACHVKNLGCLWHVGLPSSKIGMPLAHWYNYWDVGALAHKNKELTRFGMLAQEHVGK